MRLNKLIANSGVASRRKAEELIQNKKVFINGSVVSEVLTFVQENDIVEVNGQNISQWINKEHIINTTKLWLFHKPKGTITSRCDPQGRKTIFSLLPINMQNVLSIGRLDYNTEGLILLTNNGQLSRFFELPQNKIQRIYKCRVFGNTLSENNLNQIRNGITVNGIKYGQIEIVQNDRKWFTLTLKEGKNREIRNIFEYFNMHVTRLIRVQYGSFKLNHLQPGNVIEVPEEVLKKIINKNL